MRLRSRLLARPLHAVLALVLAACSSTPAPAAESSPSPVTGGLERGLVAYVAANGVGVLDPSTGKSKIVAPFVAGAFRVQGPVWGPAAGVDHPVLYFTVHDDRPAERRTSSGVVPYDWLFRVDPFAGTIDPVAASQDSQSEGPFGIVANDHWLGMTVGCCASYEVDAVDLTKKVAPVRVLARPPAQAAFFTEGVAPGSAGLIAVRGFATGAWYWLNAEARVLHPFPLKLGPDDGPIAITPDGTAVAVALPNHGAVIEPFDSSLPLASPSGAATPTATASPSAAPTPTVTAPKRVNSKLLHPDALAWSPDAKQLLVAVNGELQMYDGAASDGPPGKRYLTGQGVIGISWSAPMTSETFDAVKPSAGPQHFVDALLAVTKLPAAADTLANRPLTKVYLWGFDSTTPSPIAGITDASDSVLAKYAPLSAGLVFHHWAATDAWALLGGCYRYRIVITGSVAPVASTFGLDGNSLCSAKASPSTSPT